jgi:hypothetical protein
MGLRRFGCDRSVGQKLLEENELSGEWFGLTQIQVRQRVSIYKGTRRPLRPTRLPTDTDVMIKRPRRPLVSAYELTPTS